MSDDDGMVARALRLQLDQAATLLRRHGYAVTAPPFADTPVPPIEIGQEWLRPDNPGFSRKVLAIHDSVSARTVQTFRVTWKTRIGQYETRGTETDFLRWARKTGARPDGL